MNLEEAVDRWLVLARRLLAEPDLAGLPAEGWRSLSEGVIGLVDSQQLEVSNDQAVAVALVAADLGELVHELFESTRDYELVRPGLEFCNAAVWIAPPALGLRTCQRFTRHPLQRVRVRGIRLASTLVPVDDQVMALVRAGLMDVDHSVRRWTTQVLLGLERLPPGWSHADLLYDLYTGHAQYRQTPYDIWCEAACFLVLAENGELEIACAIAEAFDTSDLADDEHALSDLHDLVSDHLTIIGRSVAMVAHRRHFASGDREPPQWLEWLISDTVDGFPGDMLRKLLSLEPWSVSYWLLLFEVAGQLGLDARTTWVTFGVGLLEDEGVPAEMRALGADLLGVHLQYNQRDPRTDEVVHLLHAGTRADEPDVVRRSAGFAFERLVAGAGPDTPLGAEARAILRDQGLGADDWIERVRRAVAFAERVTVAPGGANRAYLASAGQSPAPTGGDRQQTTSGPSSSAPIGAAIIEQLQLYPWQRRALDAWSTSGRRGVIEAVTGAGKTRLALAAIADVLVAGGQAVVLVPTLQLGDQWRTELEQRLPSILGRTVRVGRLGGGRRRTLASCDLLVATMASASRRELAPQAGPALLVADEVHRAGAQMWSLALEPGFGERLGLTATYEREGDLGVERILDPYFGGVKASVGYGEALADGVICPFRVALVGVPFTATERAEYDEAASRAARLRSRLIGEWDCPAEPFGEFIAAVHRLSASGVAEGSRLAGFYLSAFTRRRAILAAASGKLDRLDDLAPAVVAADKTILFAQSKQAAADAVERLAGEGITGAVLHSGMDLDARARVFGGFEDGTHELIAAPRLLDEGIDVPSADLALVLASSRSRRQMIQRMGRALRPKRDGRRARLVILFVENTSEDPAEAAHEGFLEMVLPHADEVRTFSAAERAALTQYLAPGDGSVVASDARRGGVAQQPDEEAYALLTSTLEQQGITADSSAWRAGHEAFLDRREAGATLEEALADARFAASVARLRPRAQRDT